MALKVWTPASELSELRRQFDDVLECHFGHHAIHPDFPVPAPIEFYREGDKLVVQIDLPGVDPKNVEVTLSSGVLKIAGERQDNSKGKERNFVRSEVHYGRFERSIRVPPEVKKDQITSTYDKGVLKLVIALPKAMETRKVPVQRVTNGAGAKAARKLV